MVEAMIAMLLVTMLSGGLYACGIFVKKLTVYNGLAIQACGLAVEKLEEVVSSGVSDIVINAPFSNQTLVVRGDREITRSVEVLGYDEFGSKLSNLGGSVYIEVHVYTKFVSPLNEAIVTNTLSTLVRRESSNRT